MASDFSVTWQSSNSVNATFYNFLTAGLLQSSGTEWVEQRRFALRQLRDLGFGKASMEDTISEEIDKLSNLLTKVREQSHSQGSIFQAFYH
jgi:hypothetical protein